MKHRHKLVSMSAQPINPVSQPVSLSASQQPSTSDMRKKHAQTVKVEMEVTSRDIAMEAGGLVATLPVKSD